MSEEAALVAAVLATPGDDAVRLVFADWLDERADPRGAQLRRLAAAHEAARALPRPAAGGPAGFDEVYYGCQRLEAREPGLSRLFACLCVRFCPLPDERRVWDLLRAPGRAAVAAAEMHWCGLVGDPALEAACRAAKPPEERDHESDDDYWYTVHGEELAAYSAGSAAYQAARPLVDVTYAPEAAAAGATLCDSHDELEAREPARRWVVALLKTLEAAGTEDQAGRPPEGARVTAEPQRAPDRGGGKG
jgi:uncharacterized protein (TIGR02996 family)